MLNFLFFFSLAHLLEPFQLFLLSQFLLFLDLLEEITLLTAFLTGKALSKWLGKLLGGLDLGESLGSDTNGSCLELRCLLEEFFLLFLLHLL